MTTQSVHWFDRKTGVEIDDDRIVIDSVEPLPDDIREIPRPIIGPFDMNNNKTFAMFLLLLVGLTALVIFASLSARRD